MKKTADNVLLHITDFYGKLFLAAVLETLMATTYTLEISCDLTTEVWIFNFFDNLNGFFPKRSITAKRSDVKQRK